jgi:hypothetical protein
MLNSMLSKSDWPKFSFWKRKSFAFIVLVPLVGYSLACPAFGAAKAGAACTKAGSTSIVSSKKYTCVKTGKKLVWDPGIVISNPAT